MTRCGSNEQKKLQDSKKDCPHTLRHFLGGGDGDDDLSGPVNANIVSLPLSSSNEQLQRSDTDSAEKSSLSSSRADTDSLHSTPSMQR